MKPVITKGIIEMRKTILNVAVILFSFNLLTAKASDTWYKDFKPTKDSEFMKSKKGFAAQLQIVDDQSFFENWNKPGLFVQVPVTEKAKIGIPIFPIILFANPGVGTDGKCNVTCDYIVKTPQGKTYGEHRNGNIWVNMPQPEENALQLGIDYMGISIEPKDPKGKYTVEAIVTDKIKKVRIELIQHFSTNDNGTVFEGKTNGQFLSESEYNNAKVKLLDWIRNEKYQIPTSLTQKSSEDVYALIDFARKSLPAKPEMKKELFELFSVADSLGMQGAGLVAAYFAKEISVGEYTPQTKPRQGFGLSFNYPDYSLSIPAAKYTVTFPYYYMVYKLNLMNVNGGFDSTSHIVLSTGYGKSGDNSPSQASIMITLCKTDDIEGFLSVWTKSYTGKPIKTKDMKKIGGYWEQFMSLNKGLMSSIFRIREKAGYVQIVAFLGLNGTFKENLLEFQNLNLFP
jgi:hypothetical protein